MLELSAQISLLIQFVTGIVDGYGLTIEVPPEKNIFRELLQIELGVQTVEFVYYVWLVTNLSHPSITITRYFDWFITTPIMLLTLMAYLEQKSQSVQEFYTNNKQFIHKILGLNMLMLVLGLLGELNIISSKMSVLLGFVPFVIYFQLIREKFLDADKSTWDQKAMYWFYASTWSLYGVAALFPFREKNTFYNVLDLFAKNVLGIFLVFILWSNRIRPEEDPAVPAEYPNTPT
jgi:bacteriorhodopsin